MDKKKKEMILVAVLALGLGYIVYANVAPKPKKKSPAAPVSVAEEKAPIPLTRRPGAAAPTAPAEAVELPPMDDKLLQMQSARSEEPWGRDPFNPPPTPAVVEEAGLEWRGFRLTGVIPGPAGGTAVINGQVVGKGEVFQGYLLREVEIGKIALEKDGETFIITMPEK